MHGSTRGIHRDVITGAYIMPGIVWVIDKWRHVFFSPAIVRQLQFSYVHGAHTLIAGLGGRAISARAPAKGREHSTSEGGGSSMIAVDVFMIAGGSWCCQNHGIAMLYGAIYIFLACLSNRQP